MIVPIAHRSQVALLDQFSNDSDWAGCRVRVPHSSRFCLSGSFSKLETRNLKLNSAGRPTHSRLSLVWSQLETRNLKLETFFHSFPTASSTHSHNARRCVSSAEKCPASIQRSVHPFQWRPSRSVSLGST